MAIPVENTTADEKVDDFENHFKVSAGPGAGKTRWLINHINNVIRNSTRLGNSRKIACITYTNVAMEIILERLGKQIDRVEVSTIHGFLYKHIIKPFAFLIPKEYELKIEDIDGHDEIPIYKGWLYEWKKLTKQTYLSDDDKIAAAFKDLSWQFNESNELVLKTRKSYTSRIGDYSIKKESFIEYKKMYWRKGILDHEDVLFFSYILLKKNARLVDVVRAKFPYFFIDEFQDTNPIQTAILNILAEKETKVVVIGDVAQSIYGFQGAMPSQFANFNLPTIKHLEILDNHRSTKKIVKLLNTIRKDIAQNSKREVVGTEVYILVGSKNWAVKAAEVLSNGEVYSLSRDNITSNVMRSKSNLSISSKNMIEELKGIDSNGDRVSLVIALVKGVELARQNKFKESFKELNKEIKRIDGILEYQKTSLLILKKLLANYDSLKNKTLLEFHSYIVTTFLIKLAGFKAGGIKTFYGNHTFEELALSVNIIEDTSYHRTIHKAKGAEFKNVLLVLDRRNSSNEFLEVKELEFLLEPNLNDDEEHRIKYVALSRARDNLFINIPSLTDESKVKLEAQGFTVKKEIVSA